MALEAIRNLDWTSTNSFGECRQCYRELSEIVNFLAMSGFSVPHELVLDLLADDLLVASGNYQWEKYQWGQRYAYRDFDKISSAHWITIRQPKDYQERILEGDELPIMIENLPNLQRNNCEVCIFDFSKNNAAFAKKPHNTVNYDPNYFEEWFSATDVRVYVASSLDDRAGEQCTVAATPDSQPEAPRRGKLPIFSWWQGTNAVWGQIHRGELIPEKQADVEKALINALADQNGGPSEPTARPFAKAIWQEFRKP